MRLRTAILAIPFGLAAMFSSFAIFTPTASAGGNGGALPCEKGEIPSSLGSQDSGEPRAITVNGTARLNSYVISYREDGQQIDSMAVYLCITPAVTKAKAQQHNKSDRSNTGPLVGIGVVAIVLVGAFLYGARRPRSSPS